MKRWYQNIEPGSHQLYNHPEPTLPDVILDSMRLARDDLWVSYAGGPSNSIL